MITSTTASIPRRTEPENPRWLSSMSSRPFPNTCDDSPALAPARSEGAMANRSTTIVVAFVAGAAIFALAPGLSTTVQRAIGIGPQNKTTASSKPGPPEISGLLPMTDEQIKLAQVELAEVGPATI